MLAEKKIKARYVLNPVKKPLWTTDSSGIKFGKELMEKMGWCAGKGLGANEQGIQEPLRVSSKNDTKGVGYKKNEENWIEYQDEFNFLLNQLASNADNNAQIKEAEKSEVMSLEEKSKLSKARMHYQKFTREKDISKYSEKDLSCILGIGKIKKTKSETEVEKITSFKNLCETSFGVTTINSGSIKDYFKKKWTTNNLKFENSNVQQFLSGEQHISVKTNTVLEKKSTKGEIECRNEFLLIENAGEENENKKIKKHKKRKKLNLEEEIPRKKKKNTCEIDIDTQKGGENPMEIENSHENISGAYIKLILKSKEKKKKKRECDQVKEDELKYQSEVSFDEEMNSKKEEKELEGKTRNRHEEEVIGNHVEEELQNKTPKDLKKTRKKEKRAEKSLKTNNNYEGEVNEDAATEKLKNITEVAPEKITRRKKKLKLDAKFQDKDKDNFEQQWKHQKNQFEDDIEEELVKKRKKKKQKEAFLEKEEIKNAKDNAIEEFKNEINIGKEKKKKKKRGSKECSEEENNEDFLEVELGNQVVEKKSVKKKKKCLEELKNEEEGLISKKFSIEEVAVAAALSENKQKRKNKIYAETESQPEEVRKKIGKKNKERVEHKADQLQENILECQKKIFKEEKYKTKSELHLDTSGVALGMENVISSNEKENKNGKADFIGETRVAMIHTHKTALFHMKKPFLGGLKNFTTAKVLKLICGAEIERFKGANLGNIEGYGYKKKIENNVET